MHVDQTKDWVTNKQDMRDGRLYGRHWLLKQAPNEEWHRLARESALKACVKTLKQYWMISDSHKLTNNIDTGFSLITWQRQFLKRGSPYSVFSTPGETKKNNNKKTNCSGQWWKTSHEFELIQCKTNILKNKKKHLFEVSETAITQFKPEASWV